MNNKKIIGLAVLSIEYLGENKTEIKYSYLKLPNLNIIYKSMKTDAKDLNDFIFAEEKPMTALLSVVSNYVEQQEKESIESIMTTESLSKSFEIYKKNKENQL